MILTGIPSLSKETNSGLIPISVLEKFDVCLISLLRAGPEEPKLKKEDQIVLKA